MGFIMGLFQLHKILIARKLHPASLLLSCKVLPDKTMAKSCENSGEVGRFMIMMNIQPKIKLQANTTSANIKSNKVCMPSGLFFRYCSMIKEQKLKTNPTAIDKTDNRTILSQVSFSRQGFLI